MRKRIVFSLGAILVTALLVILRFAGKSAKAEAHADAAPPPVAVALVGRGPVVNSLTLSGAFRPYQEVDVHAKVAGYIRKIYVDVGDQVKSGQVLAILEVPELRSQERRQTFSEIRTQSAALKARFAVRNRHIPRITRPIPA